MASTHTTRTLAALRRRARTYDDEYLDVVADELERVYVLMCRRGAQLEQLGVEFDNEVTAADRAALLTGEGY